MKISVSIPGGDVEYLDEYARKRGLGSRSAAVHNAVRLLRAVELGAEYEGAWEEWSASDHEEAWDQAVGDGLIP